MKKGLRIGLRIAAGAAGAALLLAVIAFLLLLFDKPLVRRIARDRLIKMAGPAARFDRLDYSIFPLRVTVGSRALKDGVIEVRRRRTGEVSTVAPADLPDHVRGPLGRSA